MRSVRRRSPPASTSVPRTPSRPADAGTRPVGRSVTAARGSAAGEISGGAIVRAPATRIPGDNNVPLVELELVSVSGDHWLEHLTQRWPLKVRRLACRPMGPALDRMLNMFELTGSPADLEAAERYLRARPELEDLTVLSPALTRRFVRTIGPVAHSCRGVFEAGAVCSSCPLISEDLREGQGRWRVILPRSLRAFEALTGGSGGLPGTRSIVKLRPFVPPRSLTARQSAALELAYRLGYYRFPRKTDLQQIAKRLGVSRPTAAELLRRAEAAMLSAELLAI